jgi:hypothetical protein
VNRCVTFGKDKTRASGRTIPLTPRALETLRFWAESFPDRQSDHYVFSFERSRIAILAVMQSGDVFNLGSNLILNGDPSTPSAFQRPLFIGRKTIRGPWIPEFNVRYTRLFPLANGFDSNSSPNRPTFSIATNVSA